MHCAYDIPIICFVLFPCVKKQNSYFYGVRVRDREDEGEDRHDELGLRGVCDGGSVRHEARSASGVFRLLRNGGILRSNGQTHGALDHFYIWSGRWVSSWLASQSQQATNVFFSAILGIFGVWSKYTYHIDADVSQIRSVA